MNDSVFFICFFLWCFFFICFIDKFFHLYSFLFLLLFFLPHFPSYLFHLFSNFSFSHLLPLVAASMAVGAILTFFSSISINYGRSSSFPLVIFLSFFLSFFFFPPFLLLIQEAQAKQVPSSLLLYRKRPWRAITLM